MYHSSRAAALAGAHVRGQRLEARYVTIKRGEQDYNILAQSTGFSAFDPATISDLPDLMERSRKASKSIISEVKLLSFSGFRGKIEKSGSARHLQTIDRPGCCPRMATSAFSNF